MHGAVSPVVFKLHNGVLFGYRADAISCIFKSYVPPSNVEKERVAGVGVVDDDDDDRL
jgi:hypothetical protein